MCHRSVDEFQSTRWHQRRVARASYGSAVAALLLQLFGCSASFDERARIYVVVNPSSVQTFIGEFSTIAKARGLDPEYGRADSRDGTTLHVVEATGLGLVVLLQNVPLSSGKCPEHRGIDPGQFSMNVRPSAWVPVAKDRTVEISRAIANDLKTKGYRVMPDEVSPCSSAIASHRIAAHDT